jgi:hypothetical protein
MSAPRGDAVSEPQADGRAEPIPPKLLAFYRDDYDDDGNAVGWVSVAWAVKLPDGPAVTVSADLPPRVSVWLTLEDAAEALGAPEVDTVDPRHVAQLWRGQR